MSLKSTPPSIFAFRRRCMENCCMAIIPGLLSFIKSACPKHCFMFSNHLIYTSFSFLSFPLNLTISYSSCYIILIFSYGSLAFMSL